MEISPCWVFHTLNAYDDGARVVVALCQYPQPFDVATLWDGHGPATLDRWGIDPAAGTVAQQTLNDRAQEFPRVDDRVISRPHRYGYSAMIGEVGARVWRLYLVGGGLAFAENRMGVDQILAVRPDEAGQTYLEPSRRAWEA